MLPTGTLLFSKMKAGSKKRQMTHTGTFLFLTPISHRNFRDNTHWNTSIFEMKAGSKKRQKPRKRYFKQQIMKGFHEKLFEFEPQNDHVHTHRH